MKKLATLLVAGAAALVLSAPANAYEAVCGPLGVIHYQKEKVFDGYTLYTNHSSGQFTYLIDMEGNVVHQWKHEADAFYAELLPNGHLLRAEKGPGSPVSFGGWHGSFREYDWDGNVVWEYTHRNDKAVAHHGFDRLPNGNTAFLIWEYKPWAEAIAKGRNPNDGRTYTDEEGFKYPNGTVLHGIWPDAIIEVNPKGEVVWEYHVWDNVGTRAEQLDINFALPKTNPSKYMAGPDWTHWNAVRYNAERDAYIVDSRDWGEIYMIDRKTKSMIWRWGNPAAYGKAENEITYAYDGDQKLFGPHDVNWLPNGNVSILDNGTYRPSTNYTSGVEIKPIGFAGGEIVKRVRTKDANSLYSAYQCAAQKLPNDNWMITSTTNGHLIEFDAKGDVVWEYINPISGNTPYCVKKDNQPYNQIHRAFRYAKNDPRFAGKDLKPKGKIAPDCPDWYKLINFKPSPNGAKAPKGDKR